MRSFSRLISNSLTRKLFSGFLWFIFAWFILWIQNFSYLFQYLFILRVPILFGIFLFLLPILSVYILPKLNICALQNLYDVPNYGQAFFVIFGSFVAARAIALMFDFIASNMVSRFNLPNGFHHSFIFSEHTYILVLPTFFILLLLYYKHIREISQEERGGKNRTRTPSRIRISFKHISDFFQYFLAILFAYLVSGYLTLLSYIFEESLEINNNTLSKAVIQILSLLPENLRKGLLDNGKLTDGIIKIIVFIIITSIFYSIVYILGFTQLKRPLLVEPNQLRFPALFYINLLVSFLVLVLGSSAFYLDYLRIPVLLVFVGISACIYLFFWIDHHYKIEKPDKIIEPIDWEDAVYNRLSKTDKRTLVVVSTSGGGIHAAGWTTAVLTGLQRELGEEFAKSIGWISSVSGGSVGTMYYLEKFGLDGFPDEDKLSRIFANSTKDSLDAMVWGLAYPDFLRFIGLPFLVRDIDDRGTAIEHAWKAELEDQESSLNTWRQRINEGILPIPIFNATLVEDGRRFLISPMTVTKTKVKKDGEDDKCVDFNTLYGVDHDISIATGARLSATFPYLSPVCRPDDKLNLPKSYHIADGGYFDNFGVYTSVQMLDAFLEYNKTQSDRVDKVIFIQIIAFPELPSSKDIHPDTGWLMEAIGSLKALLKVRSATQISGSRISIRLLQEKWKNRPDSVDISYYCFYPDDECCRKQPLSWKLTQAEQKAILKSWECLKNDEIPKLKGEVARLKAEWARI